MWNLHPWIMKVDFHELYRLGEYLWLVDRSSLYSPEKDCCWLWLTFRQPVWKSSSESAKTKSIVCGIICVVTYVVITLLFTSIYRLPSCINPCSWTIIFENSSRIETLTHTLLIKTSRKQVKNNSSSSVLDPSKPTFSSATVISCVQLRIIKDQFEAEFAKNWLDQRTSPKRIWFL